MPIAEKEHDQETDLQHRSLVHRAAVAAGCGWLNATQVEPVPCSGFEKPLAEGRIADVTVSDRKMADRLKAADVRKTTLAAARSEPDLVARLEQ